MQEGSLLRFLHAQEGVFPIALSEIKNGKKESHWMWFIFPQLRGLGRSSYSYTYGISGLNEARAYLADPILSSRLYEICEALLEHSDKSATYIFSSIDSKKLKSCMTLFALVSEENSVFHKVLDCFFGGKMDHRTISILKENREIE